MEKYAPEIYWMKAIKSDKCFWTNFGSFPNNLEQKCNFWTLFPATKEAQLTSNSLRQRTYHAWFPLNDHTYLNKPVNFQLKICLSTYNLPVDSRY